MNKNYLTEIPDKIIKINFKKNFRFFYGTSRRYHVVAELMSELHILILYYQCLCFPLSTYPILDTVLSHMRCYLTPCEVLLWTDKSSYSHGICLPKGETDRMKQRKLTIWNFLLVSLLTWNCNIWMHFLAFSLPLFLPLFYAVTQLLSDPMDYSTPGFPVLHCLLEFVQIHVYWVSGAIQSSHPLSPPSPPALSLSQHQGLFQWAGSLHQVAKVLELQL